MITQIIYLEKYDWIIKVFYEVESKDEDIVLSELDAIDCEPIAFYKLASQMEGVYINSGFTYTDDNLRVTFIVMSKTTDASQFQNTFDHEKGHTASHIAKALEIDLESEDFQYLVGLIGQKMFEAAKQFMCDNCRINFYNYGKVKLKFY